MGGEGSKGGDEQAARRLRVPGDSGG